MRWWSLGLAAVPLAALAQPAVRERLVAPALPGFVVGYDVGNAEQTLREEIPRGATLQTWNRMVTTRRRVGLARVGTPASYSADTVARMARDCPGARISPVAALRVAGRPAARLQVDCPRGSDGRPETFIQLVIAGGSGDMHVKQVAWRGPSTPQILAWARGYLAGVTLCAAADRTPKCR